MSEIMRKRLGLVHTDDTMKQDIISCLEWDLFSAAELDKIAKICVKALNRAIQYNIVGKEH